MTAISSRVPPHRGLSDLGVNSAARIGGAVAGLVVAQARQGWPDFTAACPLMPWPP